jgi:hypothetical protein
MMEEMHRTIVVAGKYAIAKQICKERGIDPHATTTILAVPASYRSLIGMRKRIGDVVVYGDYDQFEPMARIFEQLYIAGFDGVITYD